MTTTPQNDWLSLFVDSLPPPYDFILTELFWHRNSLSKIGKELNVSKRTVARLRNEGLEMLRGVMNFDTVLDQWLASSL